MSSGTSRKRNEVEGVVVVTILEVCVGNGADQTSGQWTISAMRMAALRYHVLQRWGCVPAKGECVNRISLNSSIQALSHKAGTPPDSADPRHPRGGEKT